MRNDRSFIELRARERAHALLDDGSYRELLDPFDGIMSPWLGAQGIVPQSDDGMVVAKGTINGQPAVVIAIEGTFQGGSMGEVSGAKMAAALELAAEDNRNGIPTQAVLCLETGGVRLQEANLGLAAIADIHAAIVDLRRYTPVVGIIAGTVGCFGGMGFVAAATDVIVMNEEGRIGLTGPEVIEQEMGKDEFDASNKALVYRTTGAKHKYIIQDCNYLVEDKIGEFHKTLAEVAEIPMAEIEKMRRIGSLKLVQEQQELVKLVGDMQPKDSMDLWKYFGNEDPAALPEMTTAEFLKVVKRRVRS